MPRVLAIMIVAICSWPSPSPGEVACVGPARAEQLLAEARVKLSSMDSNHVSWRREFNVPFAREAQVRVETSDSLCVVASHAYERTAAYGGGIAPFAVAVVAAPSVYFVEPEDTAGRRTGEWEVRVFRRDWQGVAGYGMGH